MESSVTTWRLRSHPKMPHKLLETNKTQSKSPRLRGGALKNISTSSKTIHCALSNSVHQTTSISSSRQTRIMRGKIANRRTSGIETWSSKTPTLVMNAQTTLMMHRMISRWLQLLKTSSMKTQVLMSHICYNIVVEVKKGPVQSRTLILNSWCTRRSECKIKVRSPAKNLYPRWTYLQPWRRSLSHKVDCSSRSKRLRQKLRATMIWKICLSLWLLSLLLGHRSKSILVNMSKTSQFNN